MDMPAMTGQGLLALSEDLNSKRKVHMMPDGTTMLDTDMPDWEMKHSPGMHMMQDGSWMKDEEMVHTMPDGTVMRDMDMPAMTGQGLLALSEDLNSKRKVHMMPDGTTMLDTDMPDWEMKHSPWMHMM